MSDKKSLIAINKNFKKNMDTDSKAKKQKLKTLRWQYLKRLLNIGITIIITLTGISLAFAAGKFTEAFDFEALQLAPYPQMSLVLLVLTFSLIALWYFAVDSELEMLHVYGKDLIPPLPDIKFQIFFFAVLLSILAYFSNEPIVYSAILVVFKLIEVLLLRIRNQEISQAVEKIKDKLFYDTIEAHARKAIIHYYLKRPQIALGIIILCVAVIALSLSIYGYVSSNQRLFLSLAYSLLILALTTNEITFHVWRRKRDREIGEHFL